MTTVERYRPAHHFHTDATSNDRRTHSSANPIIKDIPPAVPSPPRFFARTSPPRRPQIPATPSPTYTMAETESSQWIFTDDEILSTPSIVDGLTPVDERCRRAKGVNFITQAGILLKLPQLTLAVASVFFHRFYMRKSLVPERGGIHQYLPLSKSHTHSKARPVSLTPSSEQSTAATALFLATKTEENCRKTKEIVISVAKVAQKNASLIIDEQSKEYWRWRDSILLYEETMLEELTFDLVLKSPYTVLYGFLGQLNLAENKPVRNVAWAFLNDSCMTTLCLTQTAKDIAVAAVYFALKFQNDGIPDNEDGIAWWEIVGGDPNKISKAVDILTMFWSENPLGRKDIPYVDNPVSGDDLEQTRRRESGGSSMSLVSQNGDAKRSPEGKPSPEENGKPPKPALEDKVPVPKHVTEDRTTIPKPNSEAAPNSEKKPSPKRRLEEAELEEGEEREPNTKRVKADVES